MNIKLTRTFRDALVRTFRNGISDSELAKLMASMAPFYTASELAVLRSRLLNANRDFEHNRKVLMSRRYANSLTCDSPHH